MIHDGMKASAAAMRVGYESASQFSREFKRYFGVTPGEDAARMRTMQGSYGASRHGSTKRNRAILADYGYVRRYSISFNHHDQRT